MPNAAPQSRRMGVFASILFTMGLASFLNGKAKAGEKKRSTNINTITSRTFRVIMSSHHGNNQRKQRQAIRRNPSLLRSKKYSHKKH